MNNQSIAHTHRLYRKFVGHVVAQSGLLAIIANTIVVPAGFIVLSLSVLTGNLVSISIAVGVVAVVGLLLAIISDGMTLSACARLRISLEKRERMRERYSQVAESEKTETVRERERQEMRLRASSDRFNILSILFFGSISACAGTLFWHRLLESLPSWQSWIFSTLFSILIAGTLVACEICKEQNNEIVRESILADHFTNEALLEDANEHAMMLLHRQYKMKIQELSENTDTIGIAVEEHAQHVYDDLLAGGKGLIPARIRREKADKELAEQAENEKSMGQLRLIHGGLHSHPENGAILTVSPSSHYEKVMRIYEKHGESYIRENINDLTKDLGIGKSTIYRHLSKIKGSAS